MIRNIDAFTRALAASFVADMNRSRTLVRAIDSGQVDKLGLHRIIMRDLRREVKGKGPVLFPQLRGLLRDWIDLETAKREIKHLQTIGMGQAAAGGVDFGAIGSSIASAIGGYFTAKVGAKAQKDIAKYQVQQQMLANRALELDAARMRLDLIRREGGPVEVARRTAIVKEEAAAAARGEIPGVGLPWWGVAAGALGVGALVFFAVKAS